MTAAPRIALISAVPAAIPPVQAALDELFPEAEPWNILDDRLLQDASDAGGLSAPLADRMRRLIEHAVIGGADAVLLTCSMYTPVAHQSRARVPVPVLGPDDAVFSRASAGDFRRVVVVSSAHGPLADSLQRLRTAAPHLNTAGVVAHDAANAARAGNLDGLVASILTAIGSRAERFDAVLLGQYSLSPAATRVQHELNIPVLAGPSFAVDALRASLTKEAL